MGKRRHWQSGAVLRAACPTCPRYCTLAYPTGQRRGRDGSCRQAARLGKDSPGRPLDSSLPSATTIIISNHDPPFRSTTNERPTHLSTFPSEHTTPTTFGSRQPHPIPPPISPSLHRHHVATTTCTRYADRVPGEVQRQTSPPRGRQGRKSRQRPPEADPDPPEERRHTTSLPKGPHAPCEAGHRQADGPGRRRGRAVSRADPGQQRHEPDDGYDGAVITDDEQGAEEHEPGKDPRDPRTVQEPERRVRHVQRHLPGRHDAVDVGPGLRGRRARAAGQAGRRRGRRAVAGARLGLGVQGGARQGGRHHHRAHARAGGRAAAAAAGAAGLGGFGPRGRAGQMRFGVGEVQAGKLLFILEFVCARGVLE